MFPVFHPAQEATLSRYSRLECLRRGRVQTLANHGDEFNLASGSIRRVPFDELVWVGSETERVVFFCFTFLWRL